jgi:hypothetical protein
MKLDISERGLSSLHAYLGELVRCKQDRIGRGDPDEPAPILKNQIAELRVLQAKIQDTLQHN